MAPGVRCWPKVLELHIVFHLAYVRCHVLRVLRRLDVRVLHFRRAFIEDFLLKASSDFFSAACSKALASVLIPSAQVALHVVVFGVSRFVLLG